MIPSRTARRYAASVEKHRKITPGKKEISIGTRERRKGLLWKFGIRKYRSLGELGMETEQTIFRTIVKEHIVKAIEEIQRSGGYGELTIVFRRSNPEFVNHKIIKRFNQPREDGKE